MINLEKAIEIINKYLKKIETEIGEEILLIDQETIEKDFGWVFFYNSKRAIKTGNLIHSLYGNAPLIVDRETGYIHETGTAYPVERYIEEYMQRKKQKQLTHNIRSWRQSS
ncbi:MAG: hypothetical protein ETSY2_40945 [Candidatus Entotheonella gemina]|uniref:Immunity protein 35 domain-containing protein n=1 Tax=Candidatus Entotheonella gemina TaxID=1429439 RepID=W4LNF0_9BACT|nr:MAG: hypothetical protein ETSY2_40945 [Candidatus Entotheonella gemina]